ncbi:MAG: hypothetical protein LBI67_10885 [Treponema sp.]|jgi:hypothetical protein|nr:hypothetical protein [Treponema sp.]
MKRFFFAVCVFLGAVLYAQDRQPSWEAGFSINTDVSNTQFTPFDLFKDKIELQAESFSAAGFAAILSGSLTFPYVKLYAFKPYELCFFLDADIMGGGKLPPDTLKFLFDEAASGNHSGEASFGGSAFASLGAKISRKFGAWKIGVNPAVYVPLFYMADNGMRFDISASGGVTNANIAFTADIYSSIFRGDSFDFSKVFQSAGFDMGVSAEYPLLSNLDLGAEISGVPLWPSRPAYKMRSRISAVLEDFDAEDIFGQTIDFKEESETVFSNNDNYRVIRPLRIGLYAVYRPLDTGLLTLVPGLGISALTFYGRDVVLFNAGLEGRLNFPSWLTTSLCVEYREKVWREKIDLAFTVKALTINLGLGVSSPEFIKSFQGNGFFAAFGLRFVYMKKNKPGAFVAL